MPTASNPHCRRIFRTPTFLKSLEELKIGPKEADDIVYFIAGNAQSGTVEHRQLGFLLKRLPWKPQLWVQFLDDGANNIYLLAMTDEDAGPRPPSKTDRLTRILDRLWVAATVKGIEWLAHLLRGLTNTTLRSPATRPKADRPISLALEFCPSNGGSGASLIAFPELEVAYSARVFVHQNYFFGGTVEKLTRADLLSNASLAQMPIHCNGPVTYDVRPLGATIYHRDVRTARADAGFDGTTTSTGNQSGRDTNSEMGVEQPRFPLSAVKGDSNQ